MSKSNKYKTSKTLATFCAKLATEKLADNIILMDLKEYDIAPADFFVICSSDSINQSKAILDIIMRQSKNVGIHKPRIEGEANAEWILIDFFDVVVHIMINPIREYYNIEKLWDNAIFYRFNEETEKLNKITNKKD